MEEKLFENLRSQYQLQTYIKKKEQKCYFNWLNLATYKDYTTLNIHEQN